MNEKFEEFLKLRRSRLQEGDNPVLRLLNKLFSDAPSGINTWVATGGDLGKEVVTQTSDDINKENLPACFICVRRREALPVLAGSTVGRCDRCDHEIWISRIGRNSIATLTINVTTLCEICFKEMVVKARQEST